MLPDGFAWLTDGMTLQLGGRSIAHMTLLGVGGKVRVTVGHWGAHPGRHVFLNRQEGAKRYIETWATKWEVEIRQGLTQSETSRLATYGTRTLPAEEIPPDPRKRRRPRGARVS